MYLRRKKIFISYAREDSTHAHALKNQLEGFGHFTFVDTESLGPGDNWRKKTFHAMQSADVIIPLLSDKSIAKKGNVRLEFEHAKLLYREKSKAVFPLRIDNCKHTDIFDNINIIDNSPPGISKLVYELNKINYKRAGILFGIVALLLVLLGVIFIRLVSWQSAPVNSIRVDFSVKVKDSKSGEALTGVKADVIIDDKNTVFTSRPSNAEGVIFVKSDIPEAGSISVKFYKEGYAQLTEKYVLKKSMFKRKTYQPQVKPAEIKLARMSQRTFTLTNAISLNRNELEEINSKTGFQLSQDGMVKISAAPANSGFLAYGENELFMFEDCELVLRYNGGVYPTGIELNAIGPASKKQLEKQVNDQLLNSVNKHKTQFIDSLIQLLNEQG